MQMRKKLRKNLKPSRRMLGQWDAGSFLFCKFSAMFLCTLTTENTLKINRETNTDS